MKIHILKVEPARNKGVLYGSRILMDINRGIIKSLSLYARFGRKSPHDMPVEIM